MMLLWVVIDVVDVVDVVDSCLAVGHFNCAGPPQFRGDPLLKDCDDAALITCQCNEAWW